MATPKKSASSKKAPSRSAKKARPVAKKARPAATASRVTGGAPRADFGKPIDGFFAKQKPGLRPIAEELRTMVERAAPDAESSIKWGMPFYSVGGAMMCAIAVHKAHVNLILSGPPGTYADPEDLLEGGGKTGRHLKIETLDGLPRDAIRRWLKTAADHARSQK